MFNVNLIEFKTFSIGYNSLMSIYAAEFYFIFTI